MDRRDGAGFGAESSSPHVIRRALFTQSWRDLTFVHWAVDPAAVAGLFPAGTHPDTVDGVTYVGLVPFRMADLAVAGSPPIPYFGDFLETNVRLYSIDDEGRRGVVFLSLDATRLLPVLTGRWGLGIPYVWSRMRFRDRGDEVDYSSTRRWPRATGADLAMRVRLGDEVAATGLERFLTDRWALHTSFAGRTWLIPNQHEPWRFRSAELLELADGLVDTAGIRVDGPPMSVLYAPGVRVRFGVPRALRRESEPAVWSGRAPEARPA